MRCCDTPATPLGIAAFNPLPEADPGFNEPVSQGTSLSSDHDRTRYKADSSSV